MSTEEVDRAGILSQVTDKKLTQAQAAESMSLSDRQVRRLMVKYRASGAAGLIHGSRGSPGNHQLSQTLKDQAMELVSTKYRDFGPTFAAEKLLERDGLKIGVGTLRGLMIKADIWQPKKRKAKHRTRRERRACYGDMEQFDGCRHDWFEGRLENGKWATLLASRDDANNMIQLQFVAYEGTRPVMAYWRDYFKTYGKPASIYLDRHSTYKVNAKSALDDDAMLSQFERAMDELGVQIIHANSPQAKGRIENLFGTLQDRLPKELRLANISTVEEANAFLKDIFLPAYNKRFCVEPAASANVHRPLQPAELTKLDAILSVQSERLINQDFTIRFKASWLQLAKVQPTLVLPKQRVTIEERLDNSLHVRLKDSYLTYQKLDQKPVQATKLPIALTSNPDTITTNTKPSAIPSPNHPWRSFKINPNKLQNPVAVAT